MLAAGTQTYRHGADFEERLEDLDRVPDALLWVVETLTGIGYHSEPAGDHKYLLNPSLQQLREAVRAAAGVAPVVVIYYTGHGLQPEGHPYYLITTETRPGLLEDTALEARQLLRLVLRRDAHGSVLPDDEQPQVLIILDCCFSGTGGVEALKESLQGVGNPNVWVLASAGSLEYAQQGRFAAALRQALLDPPAGSSQDFLSLESVLEKVSAALGAVGQAPRVFWPVGSLGAFAVFPERQVCAACGGHDGCGAGLGEPAARNPGWGHPRRLLSHWPNRADPGPGGSGSLDAQTRPRRARGSDRKSGIW